MALRLRSLRSARAVYKAEAQLGMPAGAIVYVNAGTRMASATTLRGLISVPLIVSLTLLAVLPWASRWLIKRILRMRHEWRWHHRLFGKMTLLHGLFPDWAVAAKRSNRVERESRIDE